MEAASIAGQVIVYVLLAAVWIFFSVITFRFLYLVPRYLKRIAEAQEELAEQTFRLSRYAETTMSKKHDT